MLSLLYVRGVCVWLAGQRGLLQERICYGCMKPAFGCLLRFYAHSLRQLLGEKRAHVPASAFSIDGMACSVFLFCMFSLPPLA